MKKAMPRRDTAGSQGEGDDPFEKGDINPTRIDVHVGERIRLRRTFLGMSQESLADGLGMTIHELRMHERGVARVSASRLYEISCAISCPIHFFYARITGGSVEETGTSDGRLVKVRQIIGANTDMALMKPETVDFLAAYHRIADPRVRKTVFDLIRSMGTAVAST